MTDFIGRFHPVFVHMPIGILILAVVFYFLSLNQKYASLNTAVKYSLLLGFIAAVLSCITGYLLSNSGDYDEGIVSKHQWLGIATTVVAAITYYLFAKQKQCLKWLMPLLLLLLIITGHLGGTLTHGEGYLTNGLSSQKNNNTASIKPIANAQQAVVYAGIIQPILQTKCYNCHSSAKQKGKLRLDEPAFITKGGEHGKTIVPGNISESELIKRILLPQTNEDHMPPTSKPQLTPAQIDLLHWWVAQGADFNKKSSELTQTDKIKFHLDALQAGSKEDDSQSGETYIPNIKTDKAPDTLLRQLINEGIAVSPVSQGSSYLSVSFAAVDTITNKHLQLLSKISKQIVWLKLGGTSITDDQLATIARLQQLTRLSLEKTAVSDRGLAFVNTLISIGYLNLSFTKVTEKGVAGLKGLKNLKQLYLFGTGITPQGYRQIKNMYKMATVDTGGYKLALLVTDTMIVKAPKKAK
jgi:uncharacterized membrane protein/mono/diheme cytochrome c family protein